MEVISKVYTAVVRENIAVSIGEGTALAPEPVCTVWSTEKSIALARDSNPNSSVVQSLAYSLQRKKYPAPSLIT
jgi:hypothetical protein